ncbi:hypothetical protein NIES2100_57440 [Calothrix sp. NIES-2100]|uniref:hypothetical protein n=1 Tax=Calothrix sp. NIES-2100 TaxID=1954172 RepID=UPI000B5EAFF9|nr:hypothetical protein NIES2100_57440 [Calothrix sp. NIES-2100]
MKKYFALMSPISTFTRKLRQRFGAAGLMFVFSILGFLLALLLTQFLLRFSGCVMGICHTSAGAQSTVASQVLYISPQGSGSRNGSSAQNAGILKDLPAFINKVGPGGEIRLLNGVYNQDKTFKIASGGAPGKPVLIHGTDASGQETSMPVIMGVRSNPYQPPPIGRTGKSLFKLLPGASYLTFRNIHCMNQGNGCFVFAGSKGDVTIEKTKATNVQRYVEHQPESTSQANAWELANVVIRNAQIQGYSKGAIRFGKPDEKANNTPDAHDILIEEVFGDSQRQDGDNFCMGVHLQGDVHHVKLVKTTMNNCQQSLKPNDYWNGDGFATEENVSDIYFEDTSASGNTDAGYDLKAKNSVLVRTKAADNKRNYRFWSTANAQDCVGEEPRCRGGKSCQAQVYVTEQADATLTRCTFKSTNPTTDVFQSQENGKITVQGGTIEYRGILQRVEGPPSLIKMNSVNVKLM